MKLDLHATLVVNLNTVAFMQILYNVLLNAIESSYYGGEIAVSPWLENSSQGRLNNETLVVEVFDSAKHMTDQQISKYLQNRESLILKEGIGDEPQNESSSGRGIGLGVCKKLCE